jgi:hypothetical protein
MKKIILSLLAIICFQTNFYSQIKTKSEKEILKEIEWISTNPIEKSDKEFVSKSADMMRFQMANYPEFPFNYKALFEFMDTDKNYKYYVEISVVFISNQLANKIKTTNDYDLTKSSLNSLKEVLDYYELVLEEEPNEKNSILDKYLAMTDPELKNYVVEIMSK